MNKSRRRFDQLIERLRAITAGRPDRRTGDHTQFVMVDIALSAFPVCFTFLLLRGWKGNARRLGGGRIVDSWILS